MTTSKCLAGLSQPGRRRNQVTGARTPAKAPGCGANTGTPARSPTTCNWFHRGRPLQVWRPAVACVLVHAGGRPICRRAMIFQALQAGEHHDGRRGLHRATRGFRRRGCLSVLVDDLDDLLSRVEGATPRPAGDHDPVDECGPPVAKHRLLGASRISRVVASISASVSRPLRSLERRSNGQTAIQTRPPANGDRERRAFHRYPLTLRPPQKCE